MRGEYLFEQRRNLCIRPHNAFKPLLTRSRIKFQRGVKQRANFGPLLFSDFHVLFIERAWWC